MKKKRTIIILLSVVCCIVVFSIPYIIFKHIWGLQYNSNNIGRYLSVEIDSSGLKKIGDSDGKNVKTYNIKSAYFIAASTDKISLEDAIKTHSIDIYDMCEYPFEKKKITIGNKAATDYIFENYQIIVTDIDCFIVPINFSMKTVDEFESNDSVN